MLNPTGINQRYTTLIFLYENDGLVNTIFSVCSAANSKLCLLVVNLYSSSARSIDAGLGCRQVSDWSLNLAASSNEKDSKKEHHQLRLSSASFSLFSVFSSACFATSICSDQSFSTFIMSWTSRRIVSFMLFSRNFWVCIFSA